MKRWFGIDSLTQVVNYFPTFSLRNKLILDRLTWDWGGEANLMGVVGSQPKLKKRQMVFWEEGRPGGGINNLNRKRTKLV